MPGSFRCGTEHQHRAVQELIKTGAADLSLEEVGHQPGIDALDFAGANGGFHLVEVGPLGADDHAVDGVFVQQFNEPLHGLKIEIQLAQNLDGVVRFSLEIGAHARGFLSGAHEDAAPPVL